MHNHNSQNLNPNLEHYIYCLSWNLTKIATNDDATIKIPQNLVVYYFIAILLPNEMLKTRVNNFSIWPI